MRGREGEREGERQGETGRERGKKGKRGREREREGERGGERERTCRERESVCAYLPGMPLSVSLLPGERYIYV